MKNLLAIVDRSEVKIDDIITSLLQSAHSSEMRLQVVSLSSMIERLGAAIEDKSLLRNIAVKIELDKTPEIIINADEQKLEMALLNILVNATEAVQDDTGKIEISCRRKNSTAIVQIRDNGCGMSPENKSKLLNLFYLQAKRDRARTGNYTEHSSNPQSENRSGFVWEKGPFLPYS